VLDFRVKARVQEKFYPKKCELMKKERDAYGQSMTERRRLQEWGQETTKGYPREEKENTELV